MKVLLTGSEGYIGVHIAAVLRDRGHDVTGLDAGFYREGWLYGRAERMLPEVTLRRDVRSVEAGDLEGFDAVVHLAELSNDPLGQLDPELTYRVNHGGSVRLAELAREAGVGRFLYASSCSVYGVGAGEFAVETSPLNPQTAYARCKVLVERDVSVLAGDSFSPTFFRNATAYGASPRMRFDIVLNNLAGHAWTRREIRLSSDGSPWRPLVHVLDICKAFACALEAPRDAVHDRIFNVGDNRHNHRVSEIADIVSEAFPGCAVSLGDSGGDNRSYRVSFDRIHAEVPGFACDHTPADGAAELRRIFDEVGLTLADFEDRRYTRLKQLEHLLHTGSITSELYWTKTSQAA
jgi:nucleoside-diphosphate-sugar epimerase